MPRVSKVGGHREPMTECDDYVETATGVLVPWPVSGFKVRLNPTCTVLFIFLNLGNYKKVAKKT